MSFFFLTLLIIIIDMFYHILAFMTFLPIFLNLALIYIKQF